MQRAQQRRSRRPERLSEATPQALLDAAETIFARDGFSGARVEEIAQLAGHNKALIFHYFEDKLGLYRAMMARAKERFGAQFRNALTRYEDTEGQVPLARLRELIAELAGIAVDSYAQDANMAHILAWEAAEGWQTFLACASPSSDIFYERLFALVHKAQEAGIIRADLDIPILITTFTSLPLIHMVSLARFQRMFPGEDFTSSAALAHARRQMSLILLNGILTASDDHPQGSQESSHATGL
jgi:AcrR family transcriptional regulator